jgi:hypothetical protein
MQDCHLQRIVVAEDCESCREADEREDGLLCCPLSLQGA